MLLLDPKVKKIFDSLRPNLSSQIVQAEDADQVVPLHLENISDVGALEQPVRTRNRRSTPVFEVTAGVEPDPDLDSKIRRNLRLKSNSSHVRLRRGPSSLDGGAQGGHRKESLQRDVRRSKSIVDGISQRYPSAYIKIRRQSL